MKTQTKALSSRVSEVLSTARELDMNERLLVAKLLLDSVVMPEIDDTSDWQNISLTSFQADWDNPDDEVYDNWRELYGVSKR